MSIILENTNVIVLQVSTGDFANTVCDFMYAGLPQQGMCIKGFTMVGSSCVCPAIDIAVRRQQSPLIVSYFTVLQNGLLVGFLTHSSNSSFQQRWKNTSGFGRSEIDQNFGHSIIMADARNELKVARF